MDKMLHVTGGHPHILQLLCYTLIKLHNRERRDYLTIEDVSCTLTEVVGLGEAHLTFLWGESSPQEQAVLLALAQLLSTGEPGTQGAIAGLLEQFGLHISRAGIAEATSQLVRRENPQRAERRSRRYEFTVDLMRLWLEEPRSLGLLAAEMMETSLLSPGCRSFRSGFGAFGVRLLQHPSLLLSARLSLTP